MIEKIQELINKAEKYLEQLEDENQKPWDPSKKDNDENFTPKIEKLRQYYFGIIHGLELAKDIIK